MPERPLPPGSTIGILGGGQLGRMLAVAASAAWAEDAYLFRRAGTRRPSTSPPSRPSAAIDDADALARFAAASMWSRASSRTCRPNALEAAARAAPVFPRPEVLRRRPGPAGREGFRHELGIPVAPYAARRSPRILRAALRRVKPPALLKTRRFGYDGKGQVLIRDEDEAPAALDAHRAAPAVLEGLVPFEREISVIVVRGTGRRACASTTRSRTCIENGILAISRAPARIDAGRAVRGARASPAASPRRSVHVGVLCVEMFERERAERPALIVNEIAPRVHNSGHWTIDACPVSQFENHVRAIAGWPLGEHRAPQRCGDDQSDRRRVEQLAGACRRAGHRPASLWQGARPGPAARWATSPGSYPKS